jgi:competence protein ComEC
MRTILVAVLLCAAVFAAKPLEILFIDVEGGQATLIIAPSGQSMLVDTGWPGYSNRDANRIAAAAKKAGVKKIDYVFITHFHMDHVGGAKQLADRIPVGTFVDKGQCIENDKTAKEMMETYEAAVAASASKNRLIVKAGDHVPLKGVEITVVEANGAAIDSGSATAAANPACTTAASLPRKETDPSDNAQSAGFVLKLGEFRFVDLGDLTWNKETDLVCPANRVGRADVFLASHHGLDQSNPPVLLASLQPRVVIMNNGARKGGSPSAWQVIRNSPGLQDLWQVHFAVAGGKETNVPDSFIANVDAADDGHYLQLTATPDGSFTVYNSRNKYTKNYAK